MYASDKQKKTYEFYSKTFIFSSGTVDTIRFFLNIKNKLNSRGKKFIGRYFHDHLGAVVGEIKNCNENLSKYFESFLYNNIKHQPKLVLKKKELINISSEIHNITRFDKYISDLKMLYYQKKYLVLFTRALFYIFKTNFKIISLFYNFLLKKRIKIFNKEKVLLYLQVENIKINKSKIILVKNKKKIDKLYPVELDWNFSGSEVKEIFVYLKKLDKFLKRNNFGNLELYKKYKNFDKNYLLKFQDTNHQSGGMIMANSYKNGVLNFNQKVWDIQNLYVNGSCIFNNTSFANIGLTSLAYTLKLAKHIK